MTSEQSDMNDAVKDVLPFLDVLTPSDYKLKILEHILGMTGTKDGTHVLSKHLKFLDSIIDLICHDKDELVKNECLKILVNITSTSPTKDVLKRITQDYFTEFMLKTVLLRENEGADSVSMLLTNMTQTEAYAKLVAQYFNGQDDDINLEHYISAFCDEKFNEKCELHHLGSFLANLTTFKEIRLKLLENKISLLIKLFPFTQYKKSVIRRQAVARIIKNCLFETEYHELIMSDDIDIIPHLLLPLAGPEELSSDENEKLPLDLQYLPPDKERENSKETRILLVESLFQLCATKPCRLKMKDNGCYYILREFHLALLDKTDIEEEEKSLENLIHVLIGDEPERGMENLREVEIPEELERKIQQTSNK